MEIRSRRGGVPAGRIACTGGDARSPAGTRWLSHLEAAAQRGADVYVAALCLEKLSVGLGMEDDLH